MMPIFFNSASNNSVVQRYCWLQRRNPSSPRDDQTSAGCHGIGKPRLWRSWRRSGEGRMGALLSSRRAGEKSVASIHNQRPIVDKAYAEPRTGHGCRSRDGPEYTSLQRNRSVIAEHHGRGHVDTAASGLCVSAEVSFLGRRGSRGRRGRSGRAERVQVLYGG